MKIQAKGGNAYAALDDSDAGEGVAIFFSQAADSEQRWRLDIYARLDTGADSLVGTVYVSPPNASNPQGPLTRQVAAAVCPGAKSWSVAVNAALITGQTAANEYAAIELTSSRCCTAPVGVSRVSERYGVIASVANAPQTLNILPGQTVTEITAVGHGGGGTITVLGVSIAVAAGATVRLNPKALIPAGVNALGFNGVDWSVEYLESA